MNRAVCCQDLAVAADLVRGPDEKERAQEIANMLARGTHRGELFAHCWLPSWCFYVADIIWAAF